MQITGEYSWDSILPPKLRDLLPSSVLSLACFCYLPLVCGANIGTHMLLIFTPYQGQKRLESNCCSTFSVTAVTMSGETQALKSSLKFKGADKKAKKAMDSSGM